MKYICFLFCLVFLFCCKEHPKIAISNTLEIALGDRYSVYVSNLNKAIERDSSALLIIFKVDYIEDAAGYDHGYILYQLLKLYGDEKFAESLRKLRDKDLRNVSQYIEAGIDSNENQRREVLTNYPFSASILRLKY
jgi:hypothetical protein